MSVGSLVLVFTSIVDTVPLSRSVTKRVLPSGVTTDTLGFEPTVMSGSLALVPASITDTVPLFQFGTKAVARHGPGAGAADAPTGTTPTSAPDHPNTTNRRTHRIPAACPAVPSSDLLGEQNSVSDHQLFRTPGSSFSTTAHSHTRHTRCFECWKLEQDDAVRSDGYRRGYADGLRDAQPAGDTLEP